MTERFGADTDTQRTTATTIETMTQTMDGEMRSLDGKLGALAGAWVGQSSAAFNQIMADHRERQKLFREALAAMSTQLTQSSHRTDQTEQDLAQSFNPIREVLG